MKLDHPFPLISPIDKNDVREWSRSAIDLLLGDARRSADTHLLKLAFAGLPGIAIYLKDESTHPTGSLKHRLARSLFLYGICNGRIAPNTTLVEASSGSTAVSEAYFAHLLGLRFIAVVPRSTSRQKISAIEQFNGVCHFVDNPSEVYEVAEQLARETNGHYLDQFTNAERVTDWRGNNNIAQSIFEQLEAETTPVPEWIVMSAGTGGTSATIGRYIRYRKLQTRLCVVDVDGSAFYDAWRTGDMSVTAPGSRIEGIGRPRVEPSFIPAVIDHMLRVPDAASIAAARVLSERLVRRVGGSTGTNFFGLLSIAAHMLRDGKTGALVTLICDSGDRYSSTYYNDEWLVAQRIDIAPWQTRIEQFLDRGCLLAK
jgi:cysteine synthase A